MLRISFEGGFAALCASVARLWRTIRRSLRAKSFSQDSARPHRVAVQNLILHDPSMGSLQNRSTRRGKNDLILFAACGRQTLAEGFFAMNSEACYKFAAGGVWSM